MSIQYTVLGFELKPLEHESPPKWPIFYMAQFSPQC